MASPVVWIGTQENDWRWRSENIRLIIHRGVLPIMFLASVNQSCGVISALTQGTSSALGTCRYLVKILRGSYYLIT